MKYITKITFVLLIIDLFLIFRVFDRPPVGYLHSWNQVSTLTTIKGIIEEPAKWHESKQMLFRLNIEHLSPEHRFVRYQEFPLYHLISIFVNNFGFDIEKSARFVSIIFWIIGAVAIFSIARQIKSGGGYWSLILYLTSFPFLFYGQAIMSDIAMCSMSLLGLYFIILWNQSQKVSNLYYSAFFICIASLFKSYAVVFAPIFIILGWKWNKIKNNRLNILIATVIAALPVLIWHTFTFMQPGQQEVLTHSAGSILSNFFSIKLLTKFIGYFPRYLGFIPFISLIYYLLVNSFRDIRIELKIFLALSVLYLILTSTKLLDHDYYCLIFFAPLFILTEQAIIFCTTKLQNRILYLYIFLIIAPSLLLTVYKFNKATKVNTDIVSCANEINRLTNENDMIGFLSDPSRHNAISYYADRKGMKIEGDIYPLERYTKNGINYLGVDLSPEDFSILKPWLQANKGKIKKLYRNNKLVDFKGKRRICLVYKI